MPKVSIIVPVYNKESELDRCFSSLLAQSYPDFEVVVINDGSTDNSLSLCRKWADKDDRIKLIDQKNQGISATRNRGLKESVGEYIGFVDPDDWVEPDWLEKIFSKQSADLYIWSYYKDVLSEKTVNEKSQSIALQTDGIISMRTQPNTVVELQTHFLYPLWNKLFKREIIDDNRISFEPISCWEDACFVCDYLRAAKSVCLISECFYHYCVISGKESLSKRRYTENKYSQYLTLHKHFQQLCNYYQGTEPAAKDNDLRLIHNAAGDFLYNLNSPDCELTKRDKLRYIQHVLSDSSIKNALANINPSEIKLADIRICCSAMKKSSKAAYNVGIVLNRVRIIKKKILG